MFHARKRLFTAFSGSNIRTDGIDKLMNAYKHHFFAETNVLLKTIVFRGNIPENCWASGSARRGVYCYRNTKRNKFKHRDYPMENVEQIMRKFEELPTQHRNEELFMHPMKHGSWKKHYYNVLFDVDSVDATRIKQISTNYLKALNGRSSIILPDVQTGDGIIGMIILLFSST